MKYVVTILVVAALSLLVFVYRSEFEAYLPGWVAHPAGGSQGAVSTASAAAGNGGRHGGGGGQGQGRSVTVTTAVAKTGSIPVLRQTIGTIVPVESTALTSPISGIVANVLAKDGSEVQKGDLLIQLDDRTIRANIQRDEAQLAKDQAILDSANSTLSRVETLSKSGVDTQQQFSDAAATAKQAAATVQVDQANLAADNVTLSQTQIRAPFDGKLGAVLLSAGAYVAPGADVVLLTKMKPVYAEFSLPEPDLDLVRANYASKTLTAEVHSTQDNSNASSGDIVFIDNNVDAASGTFKLRMLLDNQAENFWPGQSLKVIVSAGKMDNLVTVPMVALQPQSGGYVSFVVKPDKTVEKRKVTLALSNGNLAGVSQGIADGEQVVTEGQASLVEGTRVTVNAPPSGANDPKAEISQNGVSL